MTPRNSCVNNYKGIGMTITHKTILATLLLLVIIFLSYLATNTRYSAPEQLNTQAELSNIFSTSKQCVVTSNLSLASTESTSGGTEYIVKLLEPNILIRVFKTHFILGGYKFEGVSHDGEYEVSGSINYLSNSGADILIDRLNHFSDGIIIADAYSFCAD